MWRQSKPNYEQLISAESTHDEKKRDDGQNKREISRSWDQLNEIRGT